ncbi:MAG: DUF4252 domain-containing protein [Candidatus Zhuqueibacterota bacterium]
MIRAIYIWLSILALCLITSGVVVGQDDEIRKHPGYVDFSEIKFPVNAEESVEVTMKGPILKFVANVAHEEDRSLSRVLGKLLLIRINTFSVENSDLNILHNSIKKMESKLEGDKWEKIVRVTKRDERVNVFVKNTRENRIDGLVIMAVDDDDEAVFINIVGELDWESVEKIGHKFDIDHLENLNADY